MTLSAQRTTLGTQLIILLALLTALDAMAIDMYLPGMPSIALDFGVESGRIQQTLSIFLGGLALGQALYGPLLDRFGRKSPLIIGVAIFVAGSALAALATSVEWLMAARFLQALGAAAGLVSPRAIVADLCDIHESARIFSVLMQVMMIAPILAPLAGSYLLTHGNWRFIFWVLAILGIIGLLWSLRTIPDSLPANQRSPLHIGATLRAYYAQLKAPVFMAYTIAGGIVLGALFTYISTSAFIFTHHYQLAPAQFSYLFAGNSIALVLGGQISNMLLKRLSAHTILFIGLIIHTLAAAALLLIADTATLQTYIACLALSIGVLGLVFGNLTALTMAQAGPQAGVASALMGTLHYLVAAIIGYVASLATQGTAILPAALVCCGISALIFCAIAKRQETAQAILA